MQSCPEEPIVGDQVADQVAVQAVVQRRFVADTAGDFDWVDRDCGSCYHSLELPLTPCLDTQAVDFLPAEADAEDGEAIAEDVVIVATGVVHIVVDDVSGEQGIVAAVASSTFGFVGNRTSESVLEVGRLSRRCNLRDAENASGLVGFAAEHAEWATVPLFSAVAFVARTVAVTSYVIGFDAVAPSSDEGYCQQMGFFLLVLVIASIALNFLVLQQTAVRLATCLSREVYSTLPGDIGP